MLISDSYSKMTDNIVGRTAGYLRDNPQLESLVVGISGGIDSALTCALTRLIIDSNRLPVRFIARSLPIETNSYEEMRRADRVGLAFADDYAERNLTNRYLDLYKSIASPHRHGEDTIEEKIRAGNIKARIRMIYLFDLAHYHRGMVLSTDNLTELMLGFWTLHGDVGNYGMLQHLWKTEVYGIARYLAKFWRVDYPDRADALDVCIEAVPTDGLGITGSDLEQLGAESYQEVDNLIIDSLRGNADNSDHPVIQRMIKTQFKRDDPQSISRRDVLKGI